MHIIEKVLQVADLQDLKPIFPNCYRSLSNKRLRDFSSTT